MCVSVAQDMAIRVTDHPMSELWNFTRFLSPGELMHTGPLGGVANFVGSCMCELIFDGPFGGTTEERLQQLWEHIVFEYDVINARSRLSMLPLSLFYHGERDFSTFNGKAADCLSLL